MTMDELHALYLKHGEGRKYVLLHHSIWSQIASKAPRDSALSGFACLYTSDSEPRAIIVCHWAPGPSGVQFVDAVPMT